MFLSERDNCTRIKKTQLLEKSNALARPRSYQNADTYRTIIKYNCFICLALAMFQ